MADLTGRDLEVRFPQNMQAVVLKFRELPTVASVYSVRLMPIAAEHVEQLKQHRHKELVFINDGFGIFYNAEKPGPHIVRDFIAEVTGVPTPRAAPSPRAAPRPPWVPAPRSASVPRSNMSAPTRPPATVRSSCTRRARPSTAPAPARPPASPRASLRAATEAAAQRRACSRGRQGHSARHPAVPWPQRSTRQLA